MGKKHSVTTFYLESLILIVIVMAVILTLSGVFGLANAQSHKASLLTEAVHLAENAAESAAAYTDGTSYQAALDVINRDSQDLRVQVSENPESESLVRYDISVYDKSSNHVIYELTTTVCQREVS